MFDLGDTVRLTAECVDADGTLVNATSVTLTVTLPDGTDETETVPTPATAGQYTFDFVSSVAGRHAVRWVFTGPNTAFTDVFDVRPASPPLIVSLADAKAHLNITGTRDDEELRGWVEAATDVVENYVGPCVRRTFSEVFHLPWYGVRSVALNRSPVIAVTAISGASLTDIDTDTSFGIVRHIGDGKFSDRIEITYTAGRTVIPANITKAALIILQHLWQTQRNGSRGALPGAMDSVDPIPGIGYAVPNRALQLMDAYRLPPGVA